MTFESMFGTPFYTRTIRVAGQDVTLVSTDKVTWTTTFLGIKTNQLMPTADEQRHAEVLARVSIRKRVPRLQAGNYHPPRVFKTRRKFYLELDQARARRDAAHPIPHLTYIETKPWQNPARRSELRSQMGLLVSRNLLLPTTEPIRETK